MRKNLKLKINEALSSVLPITLIVLLLSFTLTPMPTGTLMLFIFGAALLIIGMGFFSLGADIAMMPMGDGMGRKLVGHNRTALAVIVCFLIGAVVTIAEPDLQVLARQVPAVPDMIAYSLSGCFCTGYICPARLFSGCVRFGRRYHRSNHRTVYYGAWHRYGRCERQ